MLIFTTTSISRQIRNTNCLIGDGIISLLRLACIYVYIIIDINLLVCTGKYLHALKIEKQNIVCEIIAKISVTNNIYLHVTALNN